MTLNKPDTLNNPSSLNTLSGHVAFVSQLRRGQDYGEAKPVIHIGILDYTFFKECPEFYATYKLINVNNHHVYSDKMTLSVVDWLRLNI